MLSLRTLRSPEQVKGDLDDVESQPSLADEAASGREFSEDLAGGNVLYDLGFSQHLKILDY